MCEPTYGDLQQLRCIICGKPQKQIIVFVPTESFAKKIGQLSGKQRTIFYALCDKCVDKRNISSIIESKFIEMCKKEVEPPD